MTKKHLNISLSLIFPAFLIFGMFSLFLYSCKDSLGYDPNVQIYPLIKDTVQIPPGGNDTAITKVTIDSLKILLKEQYKANNRLFYFYWEGKIVNKEIILDTAAKANFLWFSLAMQTTKTDREFTNDYRWDWVKEFEIKFAANAEQQSIVLDKDKADNRWFSLTLKKSSHMMDIYTYSKFELNSQVSIIDHDFEKKTIKISFISTLPVNAPFFTKQFTGVITLYYK